MGSTKNFPYVPTFKKVDFSRYPIRIIVDPRTDLLGLAKDMQRFLNNSLCFINDSEDTIVCLTNTWIVEITKKDSVDSTKTVMNAPTVGSV